MRKTLTTKQYRGLVLFVFGFVSAIHAQEPPGGAMPAGALPGAEYPPYLVKTYKDNAEQIVQLRKTAVDTTLPLDARYKALAILMNEYPVTATHLAADLVSDRQDKIATAAVELLVADVVMSDHKMRPGEPRTAKAKSMMEQNERSRNALRKAINDPRPEIQSRAASTLASLSDEKALAIIQDAARQGRCTAKAAVNYFALAKSDVSAPYLEKYADDPGAETQSAAVGYLAAYPKYQERAKEKYLSNENAPIEVRKAAARSLAKKGEHALPILNDQRTPPELYRETIETYVKSKNEKLTKPEIKNLRDSIEIYQRSKPESDLKDVAQKLEKLDESKR